MRWRLLQGKPISELPSRVGRALQGDSDHLPPPWIQIEKRGTSNKVGGRIQQVSLRSSGPRQPFNRNLDARVAGVDYLDGRAVLPSPEVHPHGRHAERTSGQHSRAGRHQARGKSNAQQPQRQS